MRERAFTITAVLVTLVAIAWAIMGHYDRTSPNSKARSLFGGDEGAETIRNPDKVLAFRLATPSGNPATQAALDDYLITAGPIDVPRGIAGSMSALLLSDSSYSFGGAKGCLPTFGVRIIFLRGNDELEVNFCFECGLAYVRRRGQPFSSFDFAPSSSQFAALCRQLFPDDPAFQTLP